MRAPKNFLVAVLASALGAVTVSSCAQTETHTPQEQANMKLVADFYQEIEQDFQTGSTGVRRIAEQYLNPDYIQHMEAGQAFGPGREGYIRMYEQMPAPPKPAAGSAPPPPIKVLALMADGDFVVRINSRPGAPGQQPLYIFNLFRVQDSKLAEHWDGYSRPLADRAAASVPPAAPPGK
jgi:predicted SnoaL-like aldol condensation-catalyzing enzyme